MNWLRYALMAAIFAVGYMLFLNWNTFQDEKARSNKTEHVITSAAEQTPQIPEDSGVPQAVINNASGEELPSAPQPAASVAPTQNTAPATTSSFITVDTDSLHVVIDRFGGDIVEVALPKHREERTENSPAFVLMQRNNEQLYYAQSGLIGQNGTDKSNSSRPLYSASADAYELREHDDSLSVDLHFQQGDVSITKRYTFKHDSHLIDIDYLIQNNSDQVWQAAPYGQIRRSSYEVKSDVGIGMQPYLGAAITTNDKNYDKVSFDDIADGIDSVSKQGGWVSMVQHYFISAWVPDQDQQNTFNMRKLSKRDLYILEYTGPNTVLQAGEQGTIHSAFYAGPKNLKVLEAISPYLDLTLDYSWLWFIAKPLFFALDFIHGFVGNWGVAIMILTLCIKVLFFYPSAMSYRSMAKMRKMQPIMADLKERFGDDRQKMSAELMKIYKKEKINPLGGCLPILMQMPVFIALYWVLMESVELRHAPFFLWIQDLSVKDPFFVLPLIMGATMWIQQKLNPTPTDPMQAKIMQYMPIGFTVLFLMFPAGLVLYWVVNNTLSITQQWIITRQIEKGDAN